MPRAKSGNPPWELIAFKLPPPAMQELRRVAQQAHLSVSDLLREAVALRLASAPPAQPVPTPPVPVPEAVPEAEAVPLAFDPKRYRLGLPCKGWTSVCGHRADAADARVWQMPRMRQGAAVNVRCSG